MTVQPMRSRHEQYLDLLLAWRFQQPAEWARFHASLTPDEQQEFSQRERAATV